MIAHVIDSLQLSFTVRPEIPGLLVYKPTSGGVPVPELAGRMHIALGQSTEGPEHLKELLTSVREKTHALLELLAADAPRRALTVGGATKEVAARSTKTTFLADQVQLQWSFFGAGPTVGEVRPAETLPPGVRRLLASLMTTLHSLGWDRLRRQIGIPVKERGPEVFVSYRSGKEKFAEAVATRLSHEGFKVWFDKWEVLAGDSIPGKIGEGLDRARAFVCVLSSDYPQGKWATGELEAALAKRMTDGLRIIPLLLEPMRPPGLLASLRYIDFTRQDPETFERQMGDVVDAINAISPNPFR